MLYNKNQEKFSQIVKYYLVFFDYMYENTCYHSKEGFTLKDTNQLLQLLNSRDESALELINTQYGGLIRSLALRLLGSREDAEECLNDVLLEVWNTIPPATPLSISSYACMIARRNAIDRVRKNTAEKRGGGEYFASLDELSEVISDECEADSAELRDALNVFLGNLPPFDRALFMARYFGAESVTDIAARHGISQNAATIRLSRIRSKLKIYLTKRGISI